MLRLPSPQGGQDLLVKDLTIKFQAEVSWMPFIFLNARDAANPAKTYEFTCRMNTPSTGGFDPFY